MDIDLKFLTDRFSGRVRRLRDCSIFTKLLCGYLALAIGLTILTVVTSSLVVTHLLTKSNKAELAEKASIIADIFSADGRDDPAYSRMRNIEELTEAQVIYVGSDLVARRIPRIGAPGDWAHGEESALEVSSVIDALDVQLVMSILGGETACDIREVEFMGGKVLFAGAPVYDAENNVEGAAILYRSYVEVQGLAGDMSVLILLSALVAGGISTGLAFLVSRWLLRPIQTLTKSARRMSAGYYGEPVPLDQKDEIGELGSVLSNLSYRLQGVISDLRDEKSKLMQILSGIGEGIVAVDQRGQVVHCNNAALELLELSGWDAETGPEKKRNRGCLLEMLYRAMSTGERNEAVWRNEAGRSIAAKVWPMLNEEGVLIGAVGLLRDVSEAERLEQMRKDYVANVSHELRTPLTGIRGMVEPLLDGILETEEERQDSYRVIYQETLRLEKLIGEMLDMSRLQAGRAQIELEPMDAAGVLETAKRRMAARAQEGGVALRIDVPQALPQLMGNEDRILQVLIILLDNALSFTKPGGEVTLFAYGRGEKVHIGVRDTGAGIDPVDLPYIWERFYKADKSRMRTTGTGLGLAIAKLVVECMGGLISVKSELGKGTEFEFSLERAQEA